MEKSRVGSLLMVSMVLCLGVGKSADSKCYFEDCVVDCLYTKSGKTPFSCMRLCVDQCSASFGSTLSVHDYEDDTRHFCNTRRATSVCAKLAAKENPANSRKVKECMESFSNSCNKKI